MSDAWVFAAIAHDTPPAAHSLGQVIAIADGINHAIVLEGEFTRAVGRLLAAGLMGADAASDRYWVTDAGVEVRRRWRHGRFGWIEAIPPALSRLGEPVDTGWSLPDGVFRAAVDEHQERMEEILSRLTSKKPRRRRGPAKP